MEPFYEAVPVDSRTNISRRTRRPSHLVLCSKESKERIKQMFTKVELSVSSYDTAWVAMVPSPNSPQLPCFPKCVSWILENQLCDGSWCVADHDNPLLIKDSLSSTLACILALKTWGVGEEHVNKGLLYMGSKSSSVNDKNQCAPIGFDIIFPRMIEHAQILGLNLPLSTSDVEALFQNRDFEFKRVSESNSEGSKLYLAYIAEGMGKHHEWKEIMKYQRKNGSFFNSPSATAAAFVHLQDTNCLNYLNSISEKFCNSVPTVYPLDISVSLSLVDDLERLGIDRHFKGEIQSLLDTIYRYWLDMDEEIFADMTTRAVAFRILRMHGYDISSDALAGEPFFNTPGGYNKDLQCALEIFRASQIIISPDDESILERQNMRSSNFLKQCLSKCSIHTDAFDEIMIQEVDYALKLPFYAQLERTEIKRSLENYNSDKLSILKTSYRSLNIKSKDLLELAVEDFNICQSIHRKELPQLERWIKENRLDKLKFSRHVKTLTYIYFSTATTLFSPEVSDARLMWAKNAVLTTMVDDFFDGGGSREELVNFSKLVEKWNGISATDFCSENVEIILSALQNTTNDFGEKVLTRQGYRVTSHLVEMWQSFVKANMKEMEWCYNKVVPSFEENMKNTCVTIALDFIVLPALYFIGPDVPEEVLRDTEYLNLSKAMNTCGRLLNDIQTLKKEIKDGKTINAVTVLMNSGSVTEEEALKKVRAMIEKSRRELLRLVLNSKDSVMPRACKELFWRVNKQMQFVYKDADGFGRYNDGVKNLQELVNAIFEERLHVPHVCKKSSIPSSRNEEPGPASQ
ncbi:hypothetical protein MKW94_025769 [Papaver nudicaule]|uniref:Ent-kaurene synthase n=1 Tax=Papaver nudicaule TaxID=74823 RepID=A0AA41V8U7_PAPNU|nr:hypothetical protein [Papaver nudicaule]